MIYYVAIHEVLTQDQDTVSTLHKHVLPLSFDYSLTEMSAGKLQKFLSYFIQSISWASKSEAVNLAT